MRLGLTLTICAGIATAITAPFQRGPEVAELAVAIFLGFALVIWAASAAVAIAVFLPPTAWRLLQRAAQTRRMWHKPKGRPSEDWLDEPGLV
jgi:cyanate permease